MIAVEANIRRPPNHCEAVSVFPKRANETNTEVTGSMRLINAALEGPILESPMKKVVTAMTVHTNVIIPTQNDPLMPQFKRIEPVNAPNKPKLTEAAPIT